MLKKLLLIIATFAVICVAFAIYQWQQDPIPIKAKRAGVATSQHFEKIEPRSTQPAIRIEDHAASGLNDLTKLPPGSPGVLRIFKEETGDTRYVLEWKEFEAITESEYTIVHPRAQVLLPGGQLAYVSADSGRVFFQRSGKRFDPKRGTFVGNVLITLDRSQPEWRKAHPDQINPEKHPEDIIKFWLDEVRFDLDLAQLLSDGNIKVQSTAGTLEGRGLELLWHEATRKIMKLRIAEGKQASFRSDSLVDFGNPRGNAGRDKDKNKAGAATKPAMASAEKKSVAAAPKGDSDAANVLTFADPEDLKNAFRDDRVDSYHVVFKDNVNAEQHDGDDVVGRMKAAMLEVVVELGKKEREAVQHSPGTQPAEKAADKEKPIKAPRDADDPLREGSTLVLKWTGEVLILPESTTTQPSDAVVQQESGEADRFHIIATGDPVEITSKESGAASCQRFEYHHENKQLWLTGTAEQLVHMKSGPSDDMYGEKIFIDRANGIAQIDGPGRLVSARKAGPESQMPEEVRKILHPQVGRVANEQGPEQTLLAWQSSARIEFGLYDTQVKNKTTGEISPSRKEYVKHAVFDGKVTLQQPDQAMAADHVDVVFLKPKSGAGTSEDEMLADHIMATGHVTMGSSTNDIACDSLDVAMGLDDVGHNVPVTGRARGHVAAMVAADKRDRQHATAQNSAGNRIEIRAQDEVFITLASIPVPVSEQDRAVLLKAANEQGITEASPKWQLVEAKLRDKRDYTIKNMSAKGGVTVRGKVKTRDGDGNLDVAAELLDCTFDDDRQLTQANVHGTEDDPAHVDTGDFYVRGARIVMDMATETMEVPGRGLMRFNTAQDLDGRQVDSPIPVVVTWGGQMRFDGRLNTGGFSGTVKARSENSTLDCRDLTLRFQNLPKPEAVPAATNFIEDVLHLARRPEKSGLGTGQVSSRLRKRLANLHAIGNAAIETKTYEQQIPVKGYIARTLVTHLPKWMQQPVVKPGEQPARRLASGALILGPQIVVDLIEQNLVVQGAGHLVVRDYHMPSRGAGAPRGQAGAGGAVLADASLGSLTGYSPGHTVFEWKSSMSFLNQRNIAVFDNTVVMRHVSGSQLVSGPRPTFSAELAAATGLDMASLKKLSGQKVDLTTDHMLVEFERDRTKVAAAPGTLSQATRLKSFNASGRVRIQEDVGETTRSLEGNEATYSSETGLVRVHGSTRSPALGMATNLKTGRLEGPIRANEVEFNLNTRMIRAVDIRVATPGR